MANKRTKKQTIAVFIQAVNIPNIELQWQDGRENISLGRLLFTPPFPCKFYFRPYIHHPARRLRSAWELCTGIGTYERRNLWERVNMVHRVKSVTDPSTRRGGGAAWVRRGIPAVFELMHATREYQYRSKGNA